MNKRTFLKYDTETLKKLERKGIERVRQIRKLITSLERLEEDTLNQLDLIRYAQGLKKTRKCKLYKSLSRKKAKCLYWARFPLPKELLFRVYCSQCEEKNLEVKFLTEKLGDKKWRNES